MPKSKRDKKISLTRTKKKGLDSKKQLVDEIRKCVDTYDRIFVFTVENMRNNKLQDVRMQWKQSGRFFLGKNKVMSLALGRSPEEEISENIYQVSLRLVGSCGLLFTNSSKDEVIKYFENLSEPDYARSGNIATHDVLLNPGPMPQFAHSLEPQLRQLGMPVKLERGVPTLLKDFSVCEEGDVLTPDKARILKLLGIQMAFFKLRIESMYTRGTGEFEEFHERKVNDNMDYDSKGEDEEDDENE